MATPLRLPETLPYPIRINSLDSSVNELVKRGKRLLTYSFTAPRRRGEDDAPPEMRFGTWDAPVEGTIEQWRLQRNQIVDLAWARRETVVLVKEPCTHAIQMGGLCGLCGKDMTIMDYNGVVDSARAGIQMTHASNGPTVSLAEAQRLERESAEHLLKARKLSLIVDLDQTIVHATVDPTVGDWIAEGEAWEAKQRKKTRAEDRVIASESNGDGEVNPNWDALKDVKRFRLAADAVTRAGPAPRTNALTSVTSTNKAKVPARVAEDGAVYYIKPRPGWKSFLQHVATKYEMHVYTMGTRAYAEQVCAAIDSDRKLFGGRILTRDESGSMDRKSLERLFPCDTSMVVIIDDRADVWQWSPNLVKVIPYDFFVGIGDINSAHIPRPKELAELAGATPPALAGKGTPTASAVPAPAVSAPAEPTSAAPATAEPAPAAPATEEPATAELAPSAAPAPEDPPLVQPPPTVDPAVLTTPLSSAATVPTSDEVKDAHAEAVAEETIRVLDKQVADRPLAKKQEELAEKGTVDGSPVAADNGSATPSQSTAVVTAPASSTEEKPTRKALLTNNDHELDRVQRVLDQVHGSFFEAFDQRKTDRNRKLVSGPPVDVRHIIPKMRKSTFAGVHIVFSSVIPLDAQPQKTDIWNTALAFGATCDTEISSRTTHLVAAKRGTAKVDAARRRGGIHIVWLNWFTDSIALWERQDEALYALEALVVRAPPPPSPVQDGGDAQGSSDFDTDDFDEDDDEDDPDSAPGSLTTTPSKKRAAADAAAADAASKSGTSTPGEQATLGEKGETFEVDVDWAELDAEIEAAMDESDTEDAGIDGDGQPEASGSRTPPVSGRVKRSRSATPLDDGSPGSGADDGLRSPLSKRKKMAAERFGASRLKDSVAADELPALLTTSSIPKTESAVPASPGAASAASGSTGSPDEVEEADDDFLLKELGEEWG